MMLFNHILQAGPVATTLLGLSVLALALILDRFWTQLIYPRFSTAAFLNARQECNQGGADIAAQSLSATKHGWESAITLLITNRMLEQSSRQQLALDWLVRERRYLSAGLKLLGLIAAIAPLLGLLGTVFGIIDMFKAIAQNTGPVTPALLAEGMWTAMITTALGLIIAIPCMAVSYGFEQLTQWRLNPIQDALNSVDLAFEGATSASVRKTVYKSVVRANNDSASTNTSLQNVAGAA